MSGRIYADHAATTPVRPEVVDAMVGVLRDAGLNPSSTHAEGRAARAALDRARDRVAAALGAERHEVVFTSGGSESDGLAIRGAAHVAARSRRLARPHVVTTAVEHHAVLHAVEALGDEGFAVTILPVDADGRLAPEALAAALTTETVLVSVMLANNELGTVQPVADLARVARAVGALVHCDAVQAPGRLSLDVRALGVDLLAISAHKLYGPKGVGALVVRDGVAVAPQILGGGQEAGRRSGTENVAGAVALATALDLAVTELPQEAPRLAALRDRFEEALLAELPEARIAGRDVPRLPNLTSVAVPGMPADVALLRLDLAGAAVSAGSACAAGAIASSHVLRALDVPPWVRESTLRFSFGRSTTEQEVERLARMVSEIVRDPRFRSVPGGYSPPGLRALGS